MTIPEVPAYLQSKVSPDNYDEICKWSLSGPQFPQPTAIQQRYCYPKGAPEYSSSKGGALWTMYGKDGREDLEYRLLHVYFSAKRALNKGFSNNLQQSNIEIPNTSSLRNDDATTEITYKTEEENNNFASLYPSKRARTMSRNASTLHRADQLGEENQYVYGLPGQDNSPTLSSRSSLTSSSFGSPQVSGIYANPSSIAQHNISPDSHAQMKHNLHTTWRQNINESNDWQPDQQRTITLNQ